MATEELRFLTEDGAGVIIPLTIDNMRDLYTRLSDTANRLRDAESFANALRHERDELRAERDSLKRQLAQHSPLAALDAIAHAQDARAAMQALLAKEPGPGNPIVITRAAMTFADAMAAARKSIREAEASR